MSPRARDLSVANDSLRHSYQGINSSCQFMDLSFVECDAEFLGDFVADVSDIDVREEHFEVVAGKRVTQLELLADDASNANADVA